MLTQTMSIFEISENIENIGFFFLWQTGLKHVDGIYYLYTWILAWWKRIRLNISFNGQLLLVISEKQYLE